MAGAHFLTGLRPYPPLFWAHWIHDQVEWARNEPQLIYPATPLAAPPSAEDGRSRVLGSGVAEDVDAGREP